MYWRPRGEGEAANAFILSVQAVVFVVRQTWELIRHQKNTEPVLVGRKGWYAHPVGPIEAGNKTQPLADSRRPTSGRRVWEMISNGPREVPPQAANSNGGGASRILGTGEMADRVRGFDWSTTPLGPIESWPQELVMVVNLTLGSPVPARTLWGRDHILIYND